METKLRTQLTAFGASFYQRGYAQGGAGNLSVRLPEGGILATPTNSCLGRLDSETLAKTDMNGRLLGGLAPSKELALHLAVYRGKPECKAVVHLHSTYLTALSCTENLDPDNAIRPFTPYYVMKVGRLPLIPYCKPGSNELVQALTARLPESNAFLLANHGAVVAGASLAEAADTMEELEETAKLVFVLAGHKVNYLSAPAVKALRRT